MVTVKKKLAHSPKKVATIAPPSAEPTLVATPATLTAPCKWPCPEFETTGNVAQPQKCIKKKARKGDREIHINTSQTIRATEIRPTRQVIVEPVVPPLVEGLATSGPAIAPNVGLAAAALEKVATDREKPFPKSKKDSSDRPGRREQKLNIFAGEVPSTG
ncbi:hypothetical protein ACFX2C_009023 [Malus domestica]